MITVQSNISEVTMQLASKIQNLQQGQAGYTAMLQNICSGLLYDVKNRIHQQGFASDGSRIGAYSKRPMYVSVKKNVGQPVGKRGSTKFKSGKRKGQLHASRYFSGGYGEYRTVSGQNSSGSVNLTLTGQLNQQLSLQRTATGYGFGWSDSSLLQRARALQKKYGKKIWSLTPLEDNKAISLAKQFIARAIS